jgi:hypothetical protein
MTIADEVVEQLRGMPQPLQRQVLEFVRTLMKREVRVHQGSNCCVSLAQFLLTTFS